MLRLFGFPEIRYEDDSAYSVHKYVKELTGVSTIELLGITALAFVASIVLVSVLLPNLYFRLMLWADAYVAKHSEEAVVL